MSYSGISFSGLSSGLDIESIVTRLMQLESTNLNRISAQQLALQNRQGIYGDIRTKLVSFNSALSGIGSSTAFSSVAGTSSDEDVATITTDSSAQAGTYDLSVFKLAQAHKVSSTAQANSTDALGFTGEFMVNGKAVTVAATDTLAGIATKINSTGSGVTASIINGGDGGAYLTMTSSQSGKKAAIQLSQTSGTALSSLGFLTGSATAREAVDSDTVRSYGLKNATDTLQTLTGSTKSGSFQIGASTISVDFSVDNLQSVADKINASGSGATATVVSVTENGKATSKLEISGGGIPGSFTDTDGVLESVGVLQKGYASQILGAQDAEYELDGFPLTSATNTITGVVTGATIKLLKADAVDGADTTFSFTQDTKGIKDKLKSLATAYNSVMGYIDDNSTFDTETFKSGVLFGDSLASQVEGDLSGAIFGAVGTGTFRSLADVGFTVDSEGVLSFDESKFDTAYAKDAASVKGVLTTTGSTTGTGLSYVTSSSKSKAGTYTVDISQAATKSLLIGGIAPVSPNAGGEVLTFSGQLVGSSNIQLSIDAGSSLSDVIGKINSDSRLKGLVTASDDGGKLKIEANRYGSAGAFMVVSNLAAGTDNTGIGTGSSSAYTSGLDIVGTINGEAATGSGQFLMGSSGNLNTDGLQIMYTGSTTGGIGTVTVTPGMSSILASRVSAFTDTVTGLVTAADKGLADQIADMTSSMERISAQLTLREQTLRAKFTAMESAISRMQSQQNSLSAMLGSS
jgi:flagellar hook-associated protein 2